MVTVRPLALAKTPLTRAVPFAEHFTLGRLKRYATGWDDYLPHVLFSEEIDPHRLDIDNVKGLCGGHICVFRSTPTVSSVAITTDLEGDRQQVIAALDAGYSSSILVDRLTLDDYLSQAIGVKISLCPERHQIVYWACPVHEELAEDLETVQRLIYRADLPADYAYCSFVRPHELNRRPGQAAFLGAYVSVLTKQQDYIENCVLLSALQVTSAQARLRYIKQTARQALVELRSSARSSTGRVPDLSTRQRGLAGLAGKVRDLQVALSFDVEDYATIGDVLPSLRVESFHNSLWAAADLGRQVDDGAAMVDRLADALSAEEQAVGALRTQAEGWRRLAISVPVGMVSAAAVPVTIILAFFSANVSQVTPRSSLFDFHRYLLLYLLVFLSIVVAMAVGVLIYLVGRERIEREANGAN